MHIRRLARPDREAVEDVLRSDGTFLDDEIGVALELVDSVIDAPGVDYDALVAEDGQKILGYVCFGHTPMTVGTYDLYWIATHREARGRGVATRLVTAMEDDLRRRGARIVRIETSQLEAYGAARSFYARIGYDEVGRIRDFYRPGDDLVTLAKRLPAEVKRASDLGPRASGVGTEA
jgi:ribosomal protein S18 acetylase RimI-like enzyme